MKNNCCAVIMAGGTGSRFWPISTQKLPKQFLDITGCGKSLLQQTFDRLSRVCAPENILIVTNRSWKNIVREQLPGINEPQILTEPQGKNTAPCIAYAAQKISIDNPEAVMIVAPSDHIISDESAFAETAEHTLKTAAENPILATIGIRPTRPDTGYGYIEYSDDLLLDSLQKVTAFTEKPPLEIAQQYVAGGRHLWNSGIFIWQVSTVLSELKKHLPELSAIFEKGRKIYNTGAEDAFIDKAYAECENISVDFGLMEKAENVYTAFGDFGWSDLGTRKALSELKPKDADQNVTTGEVRTYDTKNCIIDIEEGKLAVIEGLEGYIVTQCNNVLMICKKDNEQRVKEFVNDLKAEGKSEYL